MQEHLSEVMTWDTAMHTRCVYGSHETSIQFTKPQMPDFACPAADGKGEVMLTCTFFIILITVLVNGGACAHIIDRLRLQAQDTSSRRDCCAVVGLASALLTLQTSVIWRSLPLCKWGRVNGGCETTTKCLQQAVSVSGQL